MLDRVLAALALGHERELSGNGHGLPDDVEGEGAAVLAALIDPGLDHLDLLDGIEHLGEEGRQLALHFAALDHLELVALLHDLAVGAELAQLHIALDQEVGIRKQLEHRLDIAI